MIFTSYYLMKEDLPAPDAPSTRMFEFSMASPRRPALGPGLPSRRIGQSTYRGIYFP